MPNVPISAGRGAVFLSYASQDVEAAQCIGTALRAAGIEVWFDKNELEGGHAWDAKIRQQIAECALFVAIVSATTQRRPEGYFRIEWKLAAQRTHAMAEERLFLLPVVIDDTGEPEAMVPSEFRAVQWTRLPGGQTPAAFAGRVRKLLAVDGIERPSRQPWPKPKPKPPPPARVWLWAAAVAILVAAGAAIKLSRPAPSDSAVPSHASAGAVSPPPVTEADAKAIAVLPFANLSGDREQDYFSDGLTDEIINVLAREPDLRVPGRMSSFSFKGHKGSPADIARALNVSRLVEGSVQRIGNQLRIRVTLTHVTQGFSEALEAFDADAGQNVFELQGRIARAILEKTTNRKTTAAETVYTKNSTAWDLYLRGRAHQMQGPIGAKDSIPFFEQAVELDPKFALAWARLAAARAIRVIAITVENRQELPAARAALARALDLQPNLAEALIVQAMLARAVDTDFAVAEKILRQVASLHPPTADLRGEQAALARDQGRWPEALQLMRETLRLDPQDGVGAQLLAMLAGIRGEYAESEYYWKKTAALQGTTSATPFMMHVGFRLMWRGSEAALRVVERYPPDQPLREMERARVLFRLGRPDEARAVVEKHLAEPPGGHNALNRRTYVALWLAAGKRDEALRLAETIRAEAQAEFDRGNRGILARMDLIGSLLYLGQRDAAIVHLRAWREESAELAKKSTWSWLFQYAWRVAPLYGQAGLKDEAIDLLSEISAGGFQLGHSLRTHPDYAVCAGDPRFEALVAKFETWARAQPGPTDL